MIVSGAAYGRTPVAGGWLEKNEGFLDCALRELQEETGIKTSDLAVPAHALPVAPSNNRMGKTHSVSVFVGCVAHAAVEAQLCEPEKCKEWV